MFRESISFPNLDSLTIFSIPKIVSVFELPNLSNGILLSKSVQNLNDNKYFLATFTGFVISSPVRILTVVVLS